ncbi:MAG: response regulator [Capsulimonadales bacterium]|nr:response regulator [Capsulimonadales bacterium]
MIELTGNMAGNIPFSILMADDDPDDRMLAEEALAECRIRNRMQFVEDGEALLDYLKRRGRYKDPAASPRPGLILLDWNMPRKSGAEALQEIKSEPDLRSIPVIVLTTSNAEEDIAQAYQLGANSYITKPVTFDGLVEVMRGLKLFWLEIVAIPLPDQHSV